MKRRESALWAVLCVILAALAANAGCNDLAGGGYREGEFGKLPLNKAELRMATE